MRKTHQNDLIAFLHRALLVFALVFSWTAGAFSTDTAAGGRVIQVIADKDNTFKVVGEKKPLITVKPGESIVLRITSHFGGEKSRDGAEHSFVVKELRDQGWDLRLKEGTQDIPLVAPQQAGEFLIVCTVYCGRGHSDMHMKLVVKE